MSKEHNLENLEIEKIISLFHKEKPLSYKIEEIRNQETDSRWVIYVDFPNEKYVIKLASNSFTTTKRVNAWVDLICKYQEMGYYSPMLKKSKKLVLPELVNSILPDFPGNPDGQDLSPLILASLVMK